jgi:hypothetical protein
MRARADLREAESFRSLFSGFVRIACPDFPVWRTGIVSTSALENYPLFTIFKQDNFLYQMATIIDANYFSVRHIPVNKIAKCLAHFFTRLFSSASVFAIAA